MPESELPPLDTNLWFESLERLRGAACGSAEQIEKRLRQSYYLASLAPPAFAKFANRELPEADFEALLAHSAFETAAVLLVGRTLSFEIVRTLPGPEVSARVWASDICGEAHAASGCVASALIKAWLEFLLQLKGREQDLLPAARPKGRRKSQSAPPRKPILH